MIGIYYDMQLMAQKLGVEVTIGEKQEYGKIEISVEKECRLYGPEAICGTQTVWMSHGDEVVKLPEGFMVVPRSLQGLVAAIENHSIRFEGFQYHTEVTHSPKGMETLRHFLLVVCGVTTDWRIQDVLKEEIKVIKGLVGPAEHVICALSGGVDSTVATTLVQRRSEIGCTVFLLTMDYLRYKERERVMSTFESDLHLLVTCIDASDQFLRVGKRIGKETCFLSRGNSVS